jgi:predicted MFS family arabinose efflux permease
VPSRARRLTLARFLDESYDPELRRRVTLLTTSRVAANSAYRFAPPFLATIAADFHVSLVTLGLAVTVSEIGGMTAPLVGRFIDHVSRRRSMTAGLTGVTAASVIAASANGPAVFAVALLLLSLSKLVFDVGLNSWISDRVPYARRGRVIGITETSWAGALLIGVPLMAIAVALTSWRGAYVLVAVVVAGFAVAVHRRLPQEGRHRHVVVRDHVRPGRAAWFAIAGVLALMGASQCAFLTFGSWLEDSFGFTAVTIGIVVFSLGAGELLASTSTARFTDRIGKRQSVVRGASAMVPTGLLLTTALGAHVGTGLALLVVYMIGFEFAVVSSLSMATNLIPGHPAMGLGLCVGAGTLGRALTAIPATRLYDAHGFGAPMALGATLAAVCITCMTLSRRVALDTKAAVA